MKLSKAIYCIFTFGLVVSEGYPGIAGASYIPAVQAALPRLLGAAAPAGANARENRRQCLKVCVSCNLLFLFLSCKNIH